MIHTLNVCFNLSHNYTSRDRSALGSLYTNLSVCDCDYLLHNEIYNRKVLLRWKPKTETCHTSFFLRWLLKMIRNSDKGMAKRNFSVNHKHTIKMVKFLFFMSFTLHVSWVSNCTVELLQGNTGPYSYGCDREVWVLCDVRWDMKKRAGPHQH